MQELLQTKLFIPLLPADVLPRPHLVEQLNQALVGKLILVTAPAGYGKTTLITTWLQQLREQGRQVAWLSLDEGDNDIRRFFTYLVGTLCKIDESFRVIQEAHLQDLRTDISPTAVVASILNQIVGYGERAVLVLDDYHEIEEPLIHEVLSYWLDHQPPNFQLVITSRTEPQLPLPRMRVRRQVTEIGSDDLRFSRAETADFLNKHMRLKLSGDDINQLDLIAEGWVASLQLAALSLQNKAEPSEFISTFKGDNRFVVDYLVSEVLERQPGYIRDFLLQTSILERLNVQLCNAVTEQVGSQHILETLDQARLFVIPLDDRRHWYRYHHLFADCLRAELQRTAPDDAATYHERASRWLQSNGFLREAIQHALAADNKALAAELIGTNARTMLWAQGETHRPWEWIQQLPDEVIQKSPQLLITKAWLYQELFLDHGQRVTDLLHQASALLDTPNNEIPAHDRAAMAAEIALARWNIERLGGNLQQALEHCSHAFTLLQEVDDPQLQTGASHSLALTHHQLGNVTESLKYSGQLFDLGDQKMRLDHARYVSLAYRVDALRLNGQLNAADRACRQIDQLSPNPYSSGGAMLAISWCEVLRERNELEKALDYLHPAIEFLQPLPSMTAVVQTGVITLARIYQAQGKVQDALVLLSDTLRAHGESEIYYPSARVPATQALLYLQQGNHTAAQAWATRSQLAPNDSPTYQLEIDYLVLARILIHNGKNHAAQLLLGNIVGAATAGGRLARVIESMLLQGLAHQALGEQEQAIRWVGEAVALGIPAGFIRVYVDEGAALVPLLKQLAGRGLSVEPIRHLLSLIDGNKISQPTISPSSVTNALSEANTPEANSQPSADILLLNPLTDRELATLRYLASDLTIPEIAEQMVVAPSTIRTYVKRIYSKLDVHNRIEAVNRARTLSLLG